MAFKMGRKQTYINLAMNFFAFGFQFIISFYVSPIIIGKVGASAYGFIGLANDFISYAAILATVFNSVAARFIANAFYQNDFKKANGYFNSLIVANFVIVGVLGIAGIVFVRNMDGILTIPANIIWDVKLTFSIIFISYIVSLITLVFTTSTFVSNRTDIQGIRNIINHFIRSALIVIFLNFISVKIYWIALATLIATIIVAILNISLTKRLTPQLSLNLKRARMSYALELAKSGAWMTFMSISTILMRGLDLTIANKMLGAYEMGLLSIARIMPNNITIIIGLLAPIFTPILISYYAQKDIDGLVYRVRDSIHTMSIILFIPICGFLVFAYDFYSLWQTSLSDDEIMMITILSSVTVIQTIFNTATATMAQLSIVVNKLKAPVLVSLGCGLLNVAVVLGLLSYTELGIYAIVISSTVIMTLRYTLFNSFYAAYVLEKSVKIFIVSAAKSWLSIPVLIGTMLLIKYMLNINSWPSFGLAALLSAVAGYAEMLIFYKRKESLAIIKKIFGR